MGDLKLQRKASEPSTKYEHWHDDRGGPGDDDGPNILINARRFHKVVGIPRFSVYELLADRGCKGPQRILWTSVPITGFREEFKSAVRSIQPLDDMIPYLNGWLQEADLKHPLRISMNDLQISTLGVISLYEQLLQDMSISSITTMGVPSNMQRTTTTSFKLIKPPKLREIGATNPPLSGPIHTWMRILPAFDSYTERIQVYLIYLREIWDGFEAAGIRTNADLKELYTERKTCLSIVHCMNMDMNVLLDPFVRVIFQPPL
ncbi:hypothetical protein PIIN_09036 [Serendipita indica DSM 11827]|uniref:Uncharacterized protein n=1 Tax=Serendipita indica (strain DSM 11827) TaxID=1109443 RepID=G4TUQ8_SERID|nr:hypothetical protein PIIN_09036 [Serendipita indica DSM 11827]